MDRKPEIRAVQLSIVTAILLVLLIFYYPFVYLLFNFDFDNLPAANIPYFADSQTWPWSWVYMSSRFGVLWWILFTDAGFLILLTIPFIVLYLQERRENTFIRSLLEDKTAAKPSAVVSFAKEKTWTKNTVFKWALLLFTGVGLVLQLFKAGYFIFGALTCNLVQQCRLFTLQKGQSSVIPNGSWYWMTICQIAFCVIMLAYFAIFLGVPEEQKLEPQEAKLKTK